MWVGRQLQANKKFILGPTAVSSRAVVNYWPKDVHLVQVYLLGIMHQSFVTTAPTGLGNNGDIDFPLCKARVYVQQCGDISMVKALLKSRQVILKLARPVWAWNQKPRCSTSLRERCWGQNMALKPCYAPVIQGPLGAGATNDWCVSLARLAAVVIKINILQLSNIYYSVPHYLNFLDKAEFMPKTFSWGRFFT